MIQNPYQYHLIAHLFIAIFPIVLTGTLHMLLVKKNLFRFLSIPISIRLFGANKTWRGILFMTLVNGLILWFCDGALCWDLGHPFKLGAILGFAYVLFELPNSLVKRKLGIRPGEESKKHKYFFKFIDRLDSSIGVALAYYFFGVREILIAFSILLTGIVVHFLISMLLVNLKVKKSL